jgi:hypothetical protein
MNTIADALKYVEYLKERGNTLKDKIRQFNNVNVTQKVVGTGTTTQIVEQTEFTVSPKELMSEFDANAKELRLVQQAIERANHTVDI